MITPSRPNLIAKRQANNGTCCLTGPPFQVTLGDDCKEANNSSFVGAAHGQLECIPMAHHRKRAFVHLPGALSATATLG